MIKRRKRLLVKPICQYGCGQLAGHRLKNGKYCCNRSANSCPINKEKNSISVKFSHTRPEVKEKHRIANLRPETIKLRSEIRSLYWKDPIKRETTCRNMSKAKIEYYKDPINRYKTMTSFKTGYFYSNKNQKEIYHRSSYELKAYQLLEKMESVINYDIESIMITRKVDESFIKYVPDIIVTYSNGIKEMIEIKPFHRLKDPIVIIKKEMGEEYCKENNMEYTFWTEKDIFLEESA